MSHAHRTLRLATAGIGAATLALTVTSAYASSPSTVSVAGSTAIAIYHFRAIANNPTITAGGSTINCTSVTEGGTITSGPQGWYPPNTVATIDHTLAVWSGCADPGLNFAVSQPVDSHVYITGDTVSGVTPVVLPDIHIGVKDTDFGGLLCDFDVDGSVTGSFDNSSQDLSISGSSLTVTVDPNSTGADCAGQLQNGGNATFTATFHVTDTNGNEFPIIISD